VSYTKPVALITALPWLAISLFFCAVRHEPALTLASTLFSVSYEMWLKGELNMWHVVQHNTTGGQHSRVVLTLGSLEG